MGLMILITNEQGIGKEEVLERYRRKEMIEKIFDTLKNEMNGKRLRVHSREAAKGKFFIEFTGLILRCALLSKMRESGLNKKWTAPQIFAELKKLRVVEMIDGRSYLTEISKKQRTILAALNISIPTRTTWL